MAGQVFNYAAKARKFIEGTLVGMHTRAGFYADAHSAEFISDLIGRAVHFHLPDSGRILDDELRGLWGEEVRLPYPIMTIEYRATGETAPGAREVPERLAVACETTIDALPWAPAADTAEGLWPDDHRCVLVIPLSGSGSDTWTIDPIAVAMPMVPVFSPSAAEKADLDVSTPPDYFRREPGKKGCVMAAAGLIVQPGVMEQTYLRFGERAYNEIMADSTMEAMAVLGLVEALSCTNVTTEIAQAGDAALNARRARQGKLPLFETRTLVIVPGRSTGGVSFGTGHHASPRQHLRRGHIRRLQDGKKTWVNACVVGAAEAGVIGKKYAVCGIEAE
ncbi:MAG: hypothetical protein EPN36_03695 [Rhodanobacteraceae bacterium]|nr:MAG: hypothetical protein EPN36_03695 [Rhodanobacteraceae bacterium]